MTGHEDDLIQLLNWAKELDGRVLDYLAAHPSPRIATHRPVQLIAAIDRELIALSVTERRDAERQEWRERHDAELEARRLDRIVEREAARTAKSEALEAWEVPIAQRLADAGEIPAATKAELEAWRERRRKEMAEGALREPEVHGSLRPDGTIVGERSES